MSYCNALVDEYDSDDDDDISCGRRCSPGERFCREHKCKKDGCSDRNGCCYHTCVILRCLNVRLNGIAKYCVDHICVNINCMRSRYDCNIHMCIDCKDREFKSGYNKCYECLTYIDIINTMLLTEYYFGAMPRDIVNVLKGYV